MRTRTLLALITILLSLAVPTAAQTKVTAKRLPNRTLRQLAAHPDAIPIVRDKRHDERKPASDAAFRVRPGEPLPWASDATKPPPRVARTFTSNTSTVLSPGDAAGAVGPLHVVTSTNAGVTVHDRNGGQIL